MATCVEVSRTFLKVFNALLIFFGLACLAVGIWMEVDKYVMSYFIIMQRSLTDEVLVAAPAILIMAGIMLIAVGILGCVGVNKNNKGLLLMFSFILFMAMILELTVGFMVVAFHQDIHKTVKDGMINQIKDHYQFENSVGKAWNFVQVRHKCCGVDGSWDYQYSSWWYGENPGVEDGQSDPGTWVPETCCVLDFNQDRDPSKVNPQDVRPKDLQKCQEDAWGKKDGSDYLHGRGCFATALDNIMTHIFVLIGLGCGIGGLQLFGFIATCCVIYGARNLEKI